MIRSVTSTYSAVRRVSRSAITPGPKGRTCMSTPILGTLRRSRTCPNHQPANSHQRSSCRTSGLELDRDRPPLLPTRLEVLAGPELEEGRKDALRHRGDRVVVGQNGVVVVLARVGGAVLGGRQLPLQLQEVLASPQVGIGL